MDIKSLMPHFSLSLSCWFNRKEIERPKLPSSFYLSSQKEKPLREEKHCSLSDITLGEQWKVC
jgi:hypothetical protein